MSSPRIDLLFSSSKFVAEREYGITQYAAVSVVHESFRSGRTLGSSETVDSVIQRILPPPSLVRFPTGSDDSPRPRRVPDAAARSRQPPALAWLGPSFGGSLSSCPAMPLKAPRREPPLRSLGLDHYCFLLLTRLLI